MTVLHHRDAVAHASGDAEVVGNEQHREMQPRL
jgi:hypothetical protein